MTRSVAVTAVVAVVIAMLGGIPAAQAAPVGNGFVVNAADLGFILKQIRISERHAATQSPDHMCDTLVGPAVDQIPNALTSYGLRTVDGSCNNLVPGRETFATADQTFPRLTTPDFRPAEDVPPGFGPPGPSTYKGSGNVFDTQPRVASNLIVDQTSTNPAAVAAAAFPVRAQGGNAVVACKTDPTDPTDPQTGTPPGCVPSHQTLFIENVTTDVGLSPPYNSLFTFFGQFFDHGVDQTVKSGNAVFVPLKADDPLIAGKDHILGNADDLPPQQRFMVLTRAQSAPGDPNQNASNTDSPWVDQSQTYTSHSSHQVFLREYATGTGTPGANNPAAISTGKLLGGLGAGLTYPGSPDGSGGESTWASVKLQARTLLGLDLHDSDVTNIPLLAVDPYGNYLPGPARGLPQYVTDSGMVEGDLAAPVAVPANVKHFDTPFLTDIAHNADPSPQDTDNNPGTPAVAPTADADDTPTADFASQKPGTYDDEMLNAHFACGDGRCNENIALSAIHQIFHSEHDRLVDDITKTLDDPANATLKAAYQAAHVDAGVQGGANISFGFGGRLFQAARFVTEMEYQHLVFEEFARKVQPAVRPFHVYSPDVNPAIEAEFAHAVYRFGHSMLDDQVARTTVDPTTGKVTGDASVSLLTGFLNPPMYFNTKADPKGNAAGDKYTAEQAAGAIVMGSADQPGNELDEFVTETLRNNLLGLPLDLASINMARAREAGVPRLNDVRRQIFAETNDGQLAPYTNWSDFGQHLKHPESLINYVAAYGTHPSITSATTLAAKRDAARAIVNPRPAPIPPASTPPADVQPADAGDFMFGTGAYADGAGGKPTTGLDDVDLWVGGLGEVTNLFGGLLGSTFNYVFQTQLEKLQDGDRLYYLARTPGMSLRTQLEGNSFSEMIMRNTAGSTHTLKADAFGTADCKFQLANLTSPAMSGAIAGIGSVQDDPSTTDCDENKLLVKQPNGTIAYRQRNTVDPAGINGQSVYNGSDGADRVNGGNDNDTFWGGKGNDIIDGQGGDDIALGGEGNDIITDLDGADVLKGGPGNDAIDGGPGNDIPMGNEGQDFINGGANDNETFAGPGNDFIIAGQGADTVFGDSGDDWIQGGTGQDLLQGDHGAPFFDDPSQTAPGNDIFIGQNGENDYDAEGGDDIMAQNSFVDRNAGAGGFDWAIHQYNTVPANDDMEINNNLPGLPIQNVVLRDRWQETEAVSGWDKNDVIKGTSVAPSTLGGAGFTGCDALDPTGVARISGLDKLVTTFPTPLPPIVAASAAGFCPLTGQGATVAGQGNVWGEGDILLGGKGSDTITGRGANDIIDGDHAVSVRISVRNDAGTELGSTDLMENKAVTGNFGLGTTGMTLQQAVFAGLVNPGNLVAVREIAGMGATAKTSAPTDCGVTAPTNCDTAVFTGVRANYTVAAGPLPGSVTVTDNVGTDGIDTVWNMERLQFTDVTLSVPAAPTAPTVVRGSGQVTVNFTPPTNTGGLPISGFEVDVLTGTTVVRTVQGLPATARSTVVTGLTNGTTYTFTVRALNLLGPSAPSAASAAVTPAAASAPAAPVIGNATAGPASATVRWTVPANGGSAILRHEIEVTRAGVVQTRLVSVNGANTNNTVINGLTPGQPYRFRVRAVNLIGAGAFSAVSNTVTPTAAAPGAPATAVASQGAVGGARTARVDWTPPTSNGGSAITGYRVQAQRLSRGVVLQTVSGSVQPSTARFWQTGALTAGSWRFTVQAFNAVGNGPRATSNTVAAR